MRSKSYLFASLTILFLFFYERALTQSSISIGPSISSGTQSFPKNGRLGVGGSVAYAHDFFKNGAVRVHVGYDRFDHKFPNIEPRRVQDSILSIGIYGHPISIIPMRVGYQQYIFKNLVYIYAEAGVSYLLTPSKDWSTYNPNNLFTYAAGTGYRFILPRSKFLEVSLFYNHNRLNKYRNLNYFSLRAAFGLTFGKLKQGI